MMMFHDSANLLLPNAQVHPAILKTGDAAIQPAAPIQEVAVRAEPLLPTLSLIIGKIPEQRMVNINSNEDYLNILVHK